MIIIIIKTTLMVMMMNFQKQLPARQKATRLPVIMIMILMMIVKTTMVVMMKIYLGQERSKEERTGRSRDECYRNKLEIQF